MKKLIILLAFVLMAGFVQADVIVLKNGREVRGTILEEGPIFIRIKEDGSTKQFVEFLNENVKEIRREALGEVEPIVEPEPPAEVVPVTETIVEKPIEPAVEEKPPVVEKQAPQKITNETIKALENNPAFQESLTIKGEDNTTRPEAGGVSAPDVQPAQATPVSVPLYNEPPKDKIEAMRRIQERIAIEEKNQGGEFDIHKLDQATLDALVSDLEQGATLSMQDQIPMIIGFFAVFIVGFILITGALAFMVSKYIDVGDVPENNNAGFVRRMMAYLIDFAIFVALIKSFMYLAGLVVPLDSGESIFIYIVMAMGTIVYVLYVLFGAIFYENTYGRYVMGVRVIDAESKQRIIFEQAFKRAFTQILWPIEMMIIVLSKSRRRFGDAWAKTCVIKVESPHRKWPDRARNGILICAIGFLIIHSVGPIANGKMLVTTDALKYFQENRINVDGRPIKAHIDVKPHGTYTTLSYKLRNDSQGRMVEIVLRRNGDTWFVRDKRIVRKEYFGLLTYTY